MKRKENIMEIISTHEFCRTAAKIPTGMAMMIERIVLKKTRRTVKG